MFRYDNSSQWLVWFFRMLVFVFGVIIIGRLVDLQVIKGEYYSRLSENNSIRRVPVLSQRGRILARGGELLASSRLIEKYVVFDPRLGYIKVDPKEASIKNIDGSEKINEWERFYPLAEKSAHITGYLSEVFAEEVGKPYVGCKEKGFFRAGDVVGRGGLEEYYDCILRGADGELLLEVDITGSKIRVLGRKEPKSGLDLRTTVDYKLQEEVSSLFENLRGAVVVTDKNGEVLALYSSPSFDPNVFILKDSRKIGYILEDKNQPLFNRALSGVYHPGSVFKPIVAIAALQEGKIDKDFRYEDTGRIVIETPYGSFSYGNWYFSQYGEVEGKIDLTRAIARSTDTFFYKVGELLGVESLVLWTRKFGFDKKTGIDIPGEITGLIPTPEWKLRIKGESWFLGNTYHFSIGQGDFASTVIAINTAISAIANGGKICRPHLVGDVFCEDLGLSEENIGLVKEGMVAACSSGGTGFTFFDLPVKVACKTGTAETGKKDTTHAWFTFFAPADDPQIVVTVFVEEGGEGSKVAGPIARKIADFYFREIANQ